MFSLVTMAMMLAGPIGIDFSAIPVGPGRQQFEYWLVVHAANGKTFNYGEWCKFGGDEWTRKQVMDSVERILREEGCKVKRCGDVLVVQLLNGSPVTNVEVRIKDAVGAAPARSWSPRSPQEPKGVAPPPRKVKP